MKLQALLTIGLSLALSGCFLSPGAFDAALDLRRDGTFAFAYQGEVVFAVPDDVMGGKPETWRDDQATCEDQSADAMELNTMSAPACTPAQIAEQKKVWEDEQRTRKTRNVEEQKKFAALFGYTPGDDEANRRLATQIARYDGFRSAVYAGGGVFNVDYAKSGRLDHDFVFPALLQANVIFPFVLVRGQNDGAMRVSAPALVGNGALGALSRLKGAGMADDMSKMPSRTKGRFVLTTDGEILTNNTEDGPVKTPRGQVLTWTVDQRSTVPPEALVRLR